MLDHSLGQQTDSIPKKRLLDISILLALSLGMLAVRLREILDPKFSWIGDEGLIFEYAKYIAHEKLLVNPFSAGVDLHFAKLSSFYHAIWFLLLEPNDFWWRFSTLMLLPISAVLLYFWLINLISDRRVALISAILMLFSFYLQNFSIIGYVNCLGLVHFLVLNLLLTRVLLNHSTSSVELILCGLVYGLSFYVCLGPIFPLITAPYFLVCYYTQPWIWFRKRVVVIGVGALGLTIPGLFDSRFVHELWLTAASDQHHLSWLQRLQNVKAALLGFFTNWQTSHFIEGAYVDVLTAVLVIVGFLVCLFNHSKREILLIVAWLLSCLLVGLTTIYPNPALTRNFLMLPFGFAFAGVGLIFLVRKFRNYIQLGVCTTACALIALANYDRSQRYFYRVGISPQSCLFSSIHGDLAIQPQIERVFLSNSWPGLEGSQIYLIGRYFFKHVAVVDMARSELRPGPNDKVYDVRSVIADGCRGKFRRTEFLPWLPSNLF